MYCSQYKPYKVEYGDVDKDGGSGIDGAHGRVRQWYSHGGEDGWGCCGGMRDRLEEEGKRGSDCSTTPSLRLFATTQQSVELLDHHALFEGARGREVVSVFLGDHAYFPKPAGKMWDRAMVGTVVILLAEATWGTGLFEHCAERQILFRCG